jgi:hypothetical protein
LIPCKRSSHVACCKVTGFVSSSLFTGLHIFGERIPRLPYPMLELWPGGRAR